MLVLLVIGVALLAVVLVTAMARRGVHSHGVDLGAVSTRWLSELRRDDPWTR